jgi:hypothetical protein
MAQRRWPAKWWSPSTRVHVGLTFYAILHLYSKQILHSTSATYWILDSDIASGSVPTYARHPLQEAPTQGEMRIAAPLSWGWLQPQSQPRPSTTITHQKHVKRNGTLRNGLLLYNTFEIGLSHTKRPSYERHVTLPLPIVKWFITPDCNIQALFRRPPVRFGVGRHGFASSGCPLTFFANGS